MCRACPGAAGIHSAPCREMSWRVSGEGQVSSVEGFGAEWKQGQLCISKGGFCQPSSSTPLGNTRGCANAAQGVVLGDGTGAFAVQDKAGQGLAQRTERRPRPEVEQSGRG